MTTATRGAAAAAGDAAAVSATADFARCAGTRLARAGITGACGFFHASTTAVVRPTVAAAVALASVGGVRGRDLAAIDVCNERAARERNQCA
jgi:hypothetical protein